MTTHATVGDRLAEDLRGAAGVLNAAGWHHGSGLHDLQAGSHDITGAIYIATGYHQKDKKGIYRARPLTNSAGRRATDCIHWLLRSLQTNTIWEFNDRICADKNDAVDALLRAAESAERLLRTGRDVERLLS